MAKTARKGKTMHTKRVNSWRVKSRKGESGFVAEHQDSPPVQTEALLAERGTTHGSFRTNAIISQELKNICHRHMSIRTMHAKGALYSPTHVEAIDMICLKLSRILSGQAHFAEHWDDIAGYAKLGRNG